MTARTRSNNAYAWGGAYNVSRTYGVNGLNQYTAAGGASFAYDGNGNLTSDGGNTYTYDVENRLVSVSGGHNAALRYDPLGRLYEVTSAAGTTHFLYDGDALVAEYDGSGNLLRRHVHRPGADVPVMTYEGAGLSTPRFLHTDHQGSIVAMSDASGNATIDTYDEWGIPGASNAGRFQYTGQAWMAELGMYYYKARIYSPTLGRFLQTDPIGYRDQMDLYAYVANDPVNRIDPTGLYQCIGTRLCATVRNDQTAAQRLLAGRITLLRNLVRDLRANNRLSAVERQAQATIDTYLGGGAGHNVQAISNLIAAGQSIMGVLNSQAPIRATPSARTDYAETHGGLRSPIPTDLYPNYFRASPNLRQETLIHEASHKGLGTRDWNIYGSARAAEFARTNPSMTMQSADNVAQALGFTRDGQ